MTSDWTQPRASYPGRSIQELVRRGGPDEAHVDDHRGRRRAGQLQMVPGTVRSAGYPSCPCVSADAKIPIVPVEFSPPLDVVNRNSLRMEEVPRLVKGERRARAERTATARDEHPGDQRTDWLGPQDDSQVYAGSWGGAGVRPTFTAAEQARCV